MRFVCVQMIDTTGPSRQKWAVSTPTIPEIKSTTTLSGVQLDAATINQTNLIPSIVAQVICVFLCNDWVLKSRSRGSPGTSKQIGTERLRQCQHRLAQACQPAWCQVGDKEEQAKYFTKPKAPSTTHQSPNVGYYWSLSDRVAMDANQIVSQA